MPHLTTPNGTSLHHDEFGRPDDPVLLLVQGLGAHLLGWRAEFCELLAAEGFRVVRFDNRDVGLSSRFPEGGYTLQDMADDTSGLLSVLGVPAAHVVGQSMGGMVAQLLALSHPEQVLSLALVYTTPGLAHARGLDVVEGRLEVPLPTTRAEAVTYYLAAEEPCASTAYPQDTAWLAELGGLMFDRGIDLAGVARQAEATITAPDRTEALAAIAVPTTLVHGTADRLIDPSGSAARHERIAGSTLVVHEGMGHELPRALWPEICRQIVDNARRAVPVGA